MKLALIVRDDIECSPLRASKLGTLLVGAAAPSSRRRSPALARHPDVVVLSPTGCGSDCHERKNRRATADASQQFRPLGEDHAVSKWDVRRHKRGGTFVIGA